MLVLGLLFATALAASAGAASDSPFGICATTWSHAGAGTEDFNREGPLRRLELVKELGAAWERCDFWWSRLEPEPGRYQFRDFDFAVEQYQRLGVNLLVILCYSSAWHGRPPDTDQERQRYADWVAAMVSRYRGKVGAWEIWNEPNISQFWQPEPNAEHYAAMLKQAYRAAKQADPRSVIIGAVTAGTGLNFIERLLQLGCGDFMDAISVHPYQGHPPEQIMPERLAALKQLLARHGFRKPIWITEIGFQTKPAEGAPVTERQQADWLVRTNVLALAAGVRKVFWFNLQDWSETWGIIRADWSLKDGFWAYRTMTKLLGAGRLLRDLSSPAAGCRAFAFEDPGRRGCAVIVAWAPAPRDDAVHLSIETGGARALARDVLGQRLEIGRLGDRAVLRLTDSPIYVYRVPVARLSEVRVGPL
jgi:GH35 family endo-1,4-beta-xylanase